MYHHLQDFYKGPVWIEVSFFGRGPLLTGSAGLFQEGLRPSFAYGHERKVHPTR